MKKVILIGTVIASLVLVAAVAKHHKPAQDASAEMAAGRQASTNAPAPRLPQPANPATTNNPEARPQEVADLYTEVITRVEEALKNNK